METPANTIWLRDLKVICLEDIKSKKAFNIHLRPDWFTLIVVISGGIHFIDNSSNVYLSAGDMYAVPSSAEVCTIKSPLCICQLSCSMDFVFIHRVPRFGIDYMKMLTNQAPFALSLTEAELLHVVRLFGVLKEKVSVKYTIFQNQMILLCVNMILYEFSELCFKYGENIIMVYDYREKLVMNFIMLVQQNCIVHHDVNFYADSLFVSKGHLGKVLRIVTGMSAKQQISRAIISEAYLLLADKNLSITDVSDRLNFSSSASFSNFFKKFTKITPTQYRLIAPY